MFLTSELSVETIVYINLERTNMSKVKKKGREKKRIKQLFKSDNPIKKFNQTSSHFLQGVSSTGSHKALKL
jgi:hypothetical protein